MRESPMLLCSAIFLTKAAQNRILKTTPRRGLQNSVLSSPSFKFLDMSTFKALDISTFQATFQ